MSEAVAARSVPALARLATAAAAGTVVTIAAGLLGTWAYAPLIGWDGAAAVLVLWILGVTARLSPQDTASHATREDPGITASDLILIIAALASLAAVTIVLVHARTTHGTEQRLLAVFALGSVGLSWVVVQTLFMLRYARLYYTGEVGGIDFGDEPLPSYADFAYLAFTIGMCYQVSDTGLQKSDIRATALRHGLMSYAFGTVILGSTINLIAGLTG